MKISLVVPNRNNLVYFKWSYDSIRKNQGIHEVWICSAVDACTDGTSEWYEELAKNDPYFKYIVNKGSERLGHTILYNKIVEELVETDLAMIWHCDMYLCDGALDAIERLMFKYPLPINSFSSEKLKELNYQKPNEQCSLYDSEVVELRRKGYHVQHFSGSHFNSERNEWGGLCMVSEYPVQLKNRIVSLTRIEPPLHPQGPEKLIMNFGTEPETFKEDLLEQFMYLVNKPDAEVKRNTNGVFAPWAFWVNEFKEIGGHDPLFSPQSKEDSDLFNRFLLNGTEFIQTWQGFVYHMTCRGSRFNPTLTTPGKNSQEWEDQNRISTRNFIRKWGHFVRHDEYMMPQVPHKYNIGFVVKNCNWNLLMTLEPWCDSFRCDIEPELLDRYIEFEQPRTKFDLTKKLKSDPNPLPEIIVEIDGRTFNQSDMNTIEFLSDIITDSGEPGKFQLGNLRINIKEMNHYEQNLIICKN